VKASSVMSSLQRDFAKVQPISARLSQYSPKINKQLPVDHSKLLNKQHAVKDVNSTDFLLNSVSELSPKNKIHQVTNVADFNMESAMKNIPSPRRIELTTPVEETTVRIQRVENGENNITSTISPIRVEYPIDRISTITPIGFKSTDDKALRISDVIRSMRDIPKDSNIQPIKFIQTVQRDSVDIILPSRIPIHQQSLISPIEFEQSDAKENGSPFIEKRGIFVVSKESNVNPILFENQTDGIIQGSISNGLVANRYIPISRLELMDIPFDFNVSRYSSIENSVLIGLNSKYDPNSIILSILSGRHENPSKSKFSIKGYYEANFFSDEYANGFKRFVRFGQTAYKSISKFTWSGTPVGVDYFDNVHSSGFTPFARFMETEYNLDSSTYSLKVIGGVNYFDLGGVHTVSGFNTFTIPLQTDYKVDSSVYGFVGYDAPSVDYFDSAKLYVVGGFTKFAREYDTLYKTDASRFTWRGNRQTAPSYDFFDISKRHQNVGFHTFAKLYDTKYIPESSEFDWDGARSQAPAYDFFDISKRHQSVGFHTFAQLYDTKYIPEASEFDWDGTRIQAPAYDFFDISKRHQSVGFHTFAQLYDTKYIPEASEFDWDGARSQAPAYDFFDISKRHQSVGFHTFAKLYDTKYIPEASEFDWDGARSQAPSYDFFDISKRHQSVGFHTFAKLYDTKYIPEASEFDWDGTRSQAPSYDFFDISKRHQSVGFHTFAKLYDTKYIPDSSEFDWDGTRSQAPSYDFFGNANAKGFTRMMQHLITDYNVESSRFVFKGQYPTPIDYFDNTHANGFVIRTQLLLTHYGEDTSQYTFKGQLPPETNAFLDTNATGFHRFAQLYDTKYKIGSSTLSIKDISTGIDFMTNENADGFIVKQRHLNSMFKRDSTRFSWNGGKSKSPQTRFFTRIGNDVSSDRGFKRSHIDKSITYLSPSYSVMSFSGASRKERTRGIPITSFFRYASDREGGFLPFMTMYDGTLYPILKPELRTMFNVDRRGDIQVSREKYGVRSFEYEKYAPTTMGPKSWDGTALYSSLETQIPVTKTGATVGSYLSKYADNVKQFTDSLGFLTKWAITRRSPSPLDEQYEKFHLRDNSHNTDLIWNQPFVVRGIQGKDSVENERWGGFAGGFDEGLTRGGVVTRADRVLYDTQRIGKWLTTAKGLLWNIKQVGLQLMNSNVDRDPKNPLSSFLGISATRVFNPLSVLANVAGSIAGVRIPRHGLLPTTDAFLNRYEDATYAREASLKLDRPEYTAFDKVESPNLVDRQGSQSRLLMLMKELLPDSFNPIIAQDSPDPSFIGPVIRGGIESLAKRLLGVDGIVRLSTQHGGAQSYMGVGPTTIRRARTRIGVYNTSQTELLKYPSQFGAPEESFRRDVFFATKERYGAFDVDNNGDKDLKKMSYILDGAVLQNDSMVYDEKGLDIQRRTIAKLKKLKTFDPRHDSISDRLRVVNEFTVEKNGTRLSDGTSDKLVDVDSNPLKKYRTTNYDGLRRSDRRGSKNISDFRANIPKDSVTATLFTDPDVARYDTRNLEERYGFGFQGDSGVQRNLPFITNIHHTKYDSIINPDAFNKNKGDQQEFLDYAVASNKEINVDGNLTKTQFRGDRINIIDYKRANFNINTNLVYEKSPYTNGIKGTDDLIDFYFTSLVLHGHKMCPAEVIVFRATLNSFTDNFNPSWNSVKYMGRADPLYVYQGFERDMSFDFTIHIGSRDEMKPTWRKINYLASWTAPEYLKNGQMRGPMIRLNIGHIARKLPGYISSLSYTLVDSDTTWETAKLPEDMDLNSKETAHLSNPGVLQLPKTIRVSMGFTPIGVYRPEFRGVMYPLYDDTHGAGSTEVETGLIPKNVNKVNYFKEFDSLSGIPVIYSGYDLTTPTRTPYGDSPESEINTKTIQDG